MQPKLQKKLTFGILNLNSMLSPRRRSVQHLIQPTLSPRPSPHPFPLPPNPRPLSISAAAALVLPRRRLVLHQIQPAYVQIHLPFVQIGCPHRPGSQRPADGPLGPPAHADAGMPLSHAAIA